MRLPRRTRKDDVDVESCVENLDRLAAIDEARRIHPARPRPGLIDLTDASLSAEVERGLRAALAVELDAVSASLEVAQSTADSAASHVAQLEAELRTLPALDRRRVDLQVRLGHARARQELALIEAAELAHHRVVLS